MRRVLAVVLAALYAPLTFLGLGQLGYGPNIPDGYGSISVSDGSTLQAGIGAAQVKVTGFVDGGPYKHTIPSDADDFIEILKPGIYRISTTGSISNSPLIEFIAHVAVNGIVQPIGWHVRMGPAGDIVSVAAAGDTVLFAGDEVSLVVVSDKVGGNADLMVHDAFLGVLQIG